MTCEIAFQLPAPLFPSAAPCSHNRFNWIEMYGKFTWWKQVAHVFNAECVQSMVHFAQVLYFVNYPILRRKYLNWLVLFRKKGHALLLACRCHRYWYMLFSYSKRQYMGGTNWDVSYGDCRMRDIHFMFWVFNI